MSRSILPEHLFVGVDHSSVGKHSDVTGARDTYPSLHLYSIKEPTSVGPLVFGNAVSRCGGGEHSRIYKIAVKVVCILCINRAHFKVFIRRSRITYCVKPFL